jgi:putative flippase GtrA
VAILNLCNQAIRYGVVGIASNLLLYLLYLCITFVGVGHKTAMSVIYVAGILQTFLANRRWTFRHEGAANEALIRYVLAYLAGYIINLLFLLVFVDSLGLPHQGVQAVAILLVAGILFFIQKFWVFPTKSKKGEQ